MVKTHDFCLPAFEVREDAAKLASAVASYPKLLNKGKDKEEVDPGSPSEDKPASEGAGAAPTKKERRASKRGGNTESNPAPSATAVPTGMPMPPK